MQRAHSESESEIVAREDGRFPLEFARLDLSSSLLFRSFVLLDHSFRYDEMMRSFAKLEHVQDLTSVARGQRSPTEEERRTNVVITSECTIAVRFASSSILISSLVERSSSTIVSAQYAR